MLRRFQSKAVPASNIAYREFFDPGSQAALTCNYTEDVLPRINLTIYCFSIVSINHAAR